MPKQKADTTTSLPKEPESPLKRADAALDLMLGCVECPHLDYECTPKYCRPYFDDFIDAMRGLFQAGETPPRAWVDFANARPPQFDESNGIRSVEDELEANSEKYGLKIDPPRWREISCQVKAEIMKRENLPPRNLTDPNLRLSQNELHQILDAKPDTIGRYASARGIETKGKGYTRDHLIQICEHIESLDNSHLEVRQRARAVLMLLTLTQPVS